MTGTAIKYPSNRRDAACVETLHGEAVADPYRWLEDPDSKETRAFVDAENTLFHDYIKAFPHRDALKKRLTQLYDYPRTGTPFRRADRYYYFYNAGLQPQSVLYTKASLAAEHGQVFFDPNTLSSDGTVALSSFAFSESGAYFAYGLSASGSDWVTIHVKRTADMLAAAKDGDGTRAPDIETTPLEWAKFTGITWTHDDRGFTYMRYPKPSAADGAGHSAGTETDSNTNAQLYYHVVGSPQASDVLVHSDPANPEHMFGAEVSDDGRYLILTTSASCDPKNKVWVAELGADGALKAPLAFRRLVDEFESEYSFIANTDSRLFFKSSRNGADRYKIVAVDLKEAAPSFVDVVPEAPDGGVLQMARVVDSTHLLLVYLRNVKHVIRHFELASGRPAEPAELALPEGSIVDSMTGRPRDQQVFYKFASFLNPGTIWQYDFNKSPVGQPSEFLRTQVAGLDAIANSVVVEQVFLDPAQVPMYILSHRDAPRDGSGVALLYGYGGFNISVLPTFSPTWLAFIAHFRGTVAIANIRGGGENGEAWYHAGRREHKQNVFDDFQAAARFLAAKKYTSPARLAINGGSNGGLLVGACINQAPELFGCAIADVGVMDMLRFHKFTIGHAWTSDYGNPDNAADYAVVRRYSPLHNVQTAKPYPAVLLTTSDHDDRVVPLHSYKLIATLQHALPDNPHPLMIRIETKAGHGAGKPLSKRIEEASEKYSFLALAVGASYYE